MDSSSELVGPLLGLPLVWVGGGESKYQANKATMAKVTTRVALEDVVVDEEEKEEGGDADTLLP